jgi:hypothetical protein
LAKELVQRKNIEFCNLNGFPSDRIEGFCTIMGKRISIAMTMAISMPKNELNR